MAFKPRSSPVTVASGSADIQLVTGAVNALCGFSFRASGAAASTVYLRSGVVADGATSTNMLAVATVINGAVVGNNQNFTLRPPVNAIGGIWLDRDGANNVEGVVYVE